MFFIYLHEQGYKTIRKLTAKALTSNRQGYEPVVSVGQALLSWFKIPSLYRNYSQYLSDLNINTRLFSLNYASPITFAAFEGHLDSLQYWLNLGCGGGCLKTIKVLPETGNPKPRLQQLTINQEEHLLNALGLPGPGVDGLLEQLNHHAIIKTAAPIGVSLGGHCMADYKAVFDRVHQEESVLFDQMYYEINISCPNTSTGRSLHDQISDIEALLMYMRQKTSKVIVIKVSPDAQDDNLCDIASIAQGFTEVTLNAGNTQFKQCEDLGLPKSAISIGGGGFSGPQLFKRTLAMAKLLSQFKLPLIATGGVSTIHDIQALQEHNVVVVGMATQLVKNPYQIIRLNQQLASR